MFLRALEKLLRVAVATLVATIAVMVAAQVVFRYAVKEPIVWSEEFTTLCYQWLTYLGAALAVRYRAHFGVDFVVRLQRFQILDVKCIAFAGVGALYIYHFNDSCRNSIERTLATGFEQNFVPRINKPLH